MLFKTGGVKPFYVIHTSNRYLHLFNAEERNKCYLRIAELLKCNREMKGFLASGWLYDPHLEWVSPRLVYLREIPENNGAKVFFHLGVTESATKNALLKSRNRRKLYKEGSYIPAVYALVWPFSIIGPFRGLAARARCMVGKSPVLALRYLPYPHCGNVIFGGLTGCLSPVLWQFSS